MYCAYNRLAPILKEIIGADATELNVTANAVPTVKTHAASIVRVLTVLRDFSACSFKQLTDIIAVDYPDRSPRFELVYIILSHLYNERLHVHLTCDTHTLIPSVTQVYPVAAWHEREIYDMFGIVFDAHPDLRRLLTDYNFSGHPLRKDFPLSGHTQVRYDEEAGRVISEPVSLEQPYRDFDFIGDWSGYNEPPRQDGRNSRT